MILWDYLLFFILDKHQLCTNVGVKRYLYQGWTYHHGFSANLWKPCDGCSSGPHDSSLRGCVYHVVWVLAILLVKLKEGWDDMCNPDLLTSSQTVNAGLKYIGCGDLCPSYLAFLLHFLWWLPKFNTVAWCGADSCSLSRSALIEVFRATPQFLPERKLAGFTGVNSPTQKIQWM